MTDVSLAQGRRTVALACRVLAHRGLAEDVLGHVSLRTGNDAMLVRCRGPQEAGLLFTDVDDVHEVDLDGQGSPEGWAVPNELPIHAEVLRARPDVDAVVHCHPPALLVAGLAGLELRPVFGAYDIPATRLAIEGIPVYARAVLIRRRELGEEMVAAMGDARACVLRGHGLTTVGSGEHAVEQAVARAVNVETLARVTVQLAALSSEVPLLSDADVAELPDLGGGFNDVTMWRHYLRRLDQAGLGL
jgi:ribulose-5-phosphate 4-epimerase/fuculose-1-phosphate aldolase